MSGRKAIRRPKAAASPLEKDKRSLAEVTERVDKMREQFISIVVEERAIAERIKAAEAPPPPPDVRMGPAGGYRGFDKEPEFGGFLLDIAKKLRRAVASGEVICHALNSGGDVCCDDVSALLADACLDVVDVEIGRLEEAVKNARLRVHDGKPVFVVIKEAETQDAQS